MHPKMDRGLLRIGERDIWAHRQYILTEVLPASALASEAPPAPLVLRFCRELWRLISTWMAGSSAADTIGTCLALHDRTLIRSGPLRWIMSASLQICLLVGELVQQTYLTHTDEFLPTLYSLIDSREDRMGERFMCWFNFNEEDVRARLGEAVARECRRLYLWLILLRGLRNGTFKTDANLRAILKELEGHVAGGGGGGSEADDADLFICPLMANYFTSGCVRHPITILPAAVCDQAWSRLFRTLQAYLRFISPAAPSRRPALPQLVDWHVAVKSRDDGQVFGVLLSTLLLVSHLP